MKKFLKVMFGIILVLLILGAIALAICYITIPDRTKQAVDIVIGYTDKPLFIVGGSTITIGAVVFVLIRYASKVFVDNYKKQLEDYGKGVDDKLLKAQQYRDSAKELYENTTIILQGFSSQIEKVQNDLITLCETSPNAKIKALAMKEYLENNPIEKLGDDYIILSDDSGLEVDSLGGAPGIYSHRYAEKGKHCEKLISELGDKDPGALYITTICLILPDGEIVTRRGECRGKISKKPSGICKDGFEFYPIFIPDVSSRSLADFSTLERIRVSHRAMAFWKAMTYFRR